MMHKTVTKLHPTGMKRGEDRRRTQQAERRKAEICQHCILFTADCVKVSSYIAQYPILRTAQSALNFTSLTDLFTQTPSRLLREASSHMLQLMREVCSCTYPPLSIVRYSFIQLSELEQCRVKQLVQGFNTAAQDSNLGPLSRESEVLPLSHCALRVYGRCRCIRETRNSHARVRRLTHSGATHHRTDNHCIANHCLTRHGCHNRCSSTLQ